MANNEEEELPARLTPEQAFVLTEMGDKQRFIDAVVDGHLEHHINENIIYFTEQDLVEFMYGHLRGDKAIKSLDEAPHYHDLPITWKDYRKEAEDYNFADELFELVVGRAPDAEQPSSLTPDEKSCLFCGRDKFAKDLCQKHYQKIRYHYDEVTPAAIDQFKQDHWVNEQNQWSRKYDSCKGCNTSERPHHAQGYCQSCYQKIVLN